MSSVIANLQQKNAEYVSSFKDGDLALPPAKKYLVLTCMDARIDPAAAFGISLGDAHVIRNAGANADDALRSIIISQQLLGTKTVLLLKHTGCGMLTFKEADARGVVKGNLGDVGLAALDKTGIKFGPFPELDQAVRDDVALLKNSGLLADDIEVWGGVYEVETGKVRAVN